MDRVVADGTDPGCVPRLVPAGNVAAVDMMFHECGLPAADRALLCARPHHFSLCLLGHDSGEVFRAFSP